MSKLSVSLLMILLAAGTLAQAQPSGGHGRGGGGRGRPPTSGGPAPGAQKAPPPKPAQPLNQVEIIGVVRVIDQGAGRVTIDYEAVEALGWPRGSMPFVVYKPALLDNVTVGEKVRFKLDSQQISELRPF